MRVVSSRPVKRNRDAGIYGCPRHGKHRRRLDQLATKYKPIFTDGDWRLHGSLVDIKRHYVETVMVVTFAFYEFNRCILCKLKRCKQPAALMAVNAVFEHSKNGG